MTEHATITERTRIPLALVVPVVIGAVYLLVTLNDIQNLLSTMQQDIAEIREDGTTRADIESWIRELRISNPDLTIPEISGG